MFEPRDYQKSGIQACINILTSKKPTREIVVSPTGGGKSLYIAFALKSVDTPLIVLQPSKELLKQNYDKFLKLGGEAEIFSASMKSFSFGKVTFATIGSIKNKTEEVKKLGVKCLIIDEAHLGTKSDSQIRKFIKKSGITNILGLTATPVFLHPTKNGAELKMMNRVRGKLFSNIAHVTQIKELVDKGFWSKLIYNPENQDEIFLEENSAGSDYTNESLKEYYENNNLDFKIRGYINSPLLESRKSILVFVPSIEDAERLSQTIPGSEVVHSKIPQKERDDIVKRFTTLETKVVINVNILSVGFDHPELDTIITARSTMSIGIYYQQIGRGVRLSKNKKDCLVIDLSGNYRRFGCVEDINFEFIEGYGWGMFSGENLMSNYPLSVKYRPTKKSLRNGVIKKREEVFQIKKYQEPKTKIWFGIHKDKTVEQVGKDSKSYLIWMIENFDFKGEKMIKLQNEIKEFLNL